MKPQLAFLAAVSLLWTGYAHAHGPTRQKTEEHIEINASPATVWAVVGDYAHPEKWQPQLKETVVQGNATQKGTIRELTLKSSGTLKEELLQYDEKEMSFKYKVIDPTDPAVLPVNNYSSTLSVAPSSTGSIVTWKSAYYRWYLNNNPPSGQDENAANNAVTTIYKESLSKLKSVLENGK